MGNGQQIPRDWRREDTEEARGRRSHGGQAHNKADGAEQS
jgi:hypothetical protein